MNALLEEDKETDGILLPGISCEPARIAWRNGIGRVLSPLHLAVLRSAILRDERRIVQGITVRGVLPADAVLMNEPDWPEQMPPAQACALAYCGWNAEQLATVGQVKRFFRDITAEADRLLSIDPGREDFRPSCNSFTVWHDLTPRAQMLAELACEVELSIQIRREAARGNAS